MKSFDAFKCGLVLVEAHAFVIIIIAGKMIFYSR